MAAAADFVAFVITFSVPSELSFILHFEGLPRTRRVAPIQALLLCDDIVESHSSSQTQPYAASFGLHNDINYLILNKSF